MNVEEQQTASFSRRRLLGLRTGVSGDVTYTERNLMGTGQYLQVQLSGSVGPEGLTVSWTEPRFLDRQPVLRRGRLHQECRSAQAAGYTIAGYEDFRVGSGLRFGVPITDEFSVGFNYA